MDVASWDRMIPTIEAALGHQLFEWQKAYLKTGELPSLARASGRTTVYCVRIILTYPVPINLAQVESLRDEDHGESYRRWFRRFFMDTWERLKEAGLPVVQIADKQSTHKGLSVSVNVMNLNPVKRAVQIMCAVFEDDRIPLEIRTEYLDKYNGIEWEADAEQT
ncbi:hypothetical protein H1230_09185 [Paenibacillus sp. 19GGS1-52]|uniref:hypothetical protein n=1 Tax=Paenibacillus sp. 19GGS1-52 TaxID=2758563 RepID=UPI001EFA8F1D|nr:hypothetical protein [Paenibacillus sp. 19GGS1-52]ULO08923.1 hypothetical protein H1230_09185 [Paenibacillus sp. 19GGS1-52]